jgi:hypothetical protein
MTDAWQPVWFDQLQWSPARLASAVTLGMLPDGAGLYAFTRDAGPLSSENTLYVGKADGARQSLRRRVGVYLAHFANAKSPQSRHAGLRALKAYYLASPDALFLRWTGVVVARDLEGTLVAMLDPPFNGKDEHRMGFADDERIPEEMLFPVV